MGVAGINSPCANGRKDPLQCGFKWQSFLHFIVVFNLLLPFKFCSWDFGIFISVLAFLAMF